jgi:mitochondrial fission protein ELM1
MRANRAWCGEALAPGAVCPVVFSRGDKRVPPPGLPVRWPPCHGADAVAHILSIWLLGDGKPGHENQALGLAEALARLRPCAVARICLAGRRGLLPRLGAALRAGADLPKPDLIIAAGHATHPALLWLARKHRVPSIVLMRPSLPLRWFNLCIAPAHDFNHAPAAANVLTTMGALNRVLANPSAPRHGGLILVGGPSATHGWDEGGLLGALARISGEASGGPWQLTDSRRTPSGLLARVRQQVPAVTVFPHAETTGDWLPRRLAGAAEVWVTEDSVSMVYEALSSGARVGLLPVPRTKPDTRVLRGLGRLIAEGWVTPYERWCQTRCLAAPPHPLQEASRCAEATLTKLRSALPPG